jgi:hypothetical protein
MFIVLAIGVVTKAAGMNIVGADQKGEIIFTVSCDNAHTAVLLMGFGLFFNMLLSLYPGSPST